MRRNLRGRHTWRTSALWLAIVGTGLATAIATAGMTTKDDAKAMTRAITRQRVVAGLAADAPAPKKESPFTADEMLAAAASFEQEMNTVLAHGETLRIAAYRSRDIIRMNCIDDKLGQIMTIITIAKPRFTTIKGLTGDLFHMRADFTTIREGAERVKELVGELESCLGDVLDATTLDKLGQENTPGSAETDPTLPPEPSHQVDRPGNASPYR